MSTAWEDPPEYRGGGGGVHLALPSMGPVTKRLVIANVVVWLLLWLLTFGGDGPVRWVVRVFGLAPATWIDWAPFFPIWQLLTWGWLHAPGDIGHILFNMLGLYFLGSMLEGIVGSRRYLVFYVATLIAAGLVVLLVGFFDLRPTIGASGGVLGVVIACATLRPGARIIFIIFPMTLKVFAIGYVAIEVFSTIQELRGASSGVSRAAHLAGAAIGFAAVRFGWIWRDPVAVWEARRAVRDADRQVDEQRKLDALLQRIHEHGMHSLSERERAFLRRVSKRDS